MASIRILKQYGYHASFTCGLAIDAPGAQFPLVVGCSVRSPHGEIIDLPAKRIASPGRAIWSIKAPKECQTGELADSEWHGEVIFALWKDESFQSRLADTGWMRWDASWLIGSSVRGVEENDEDIRDEYAGRLDALRDM